jgi:hypothetical protein
MNAGRGRTRGPCPYRSLARVDAPGVSAPIWEHLHSGEPERIVNGPVERVDVHADRADTHELLTVCQLAAAAVARPSARGARQP